MLETHRVQPDGFRIQSIFPDLHFSTVLLVVDISQHIYLMSGRHVLLFGIMTICVCRGPLRWQQSGFFATSFVI